MYNVREGGRGSFKETPPEPPTRIRGKRGTAGNIRHTHLVLVTYLDEHNIVPWWRGLLFGTCLPQITIMLLC